jgi:SOS-response transcriptional repressor LexA
MNEVLKELPYLTRRQLDTLAWIWRYWVAHSHAPTQREIAAAMGASSRTATAAPFIDPLVAKGYLLKTSAASRNLTITAQAIAKLKFEGVASSASSATEGERGM